MRIVIGILACLFLATAVRAEEPQPAMEVTTEVKREKDRKTKHESLRFLRDHRVFLRAQMDRLSLLTSLSERGKATMIDDRMLRLQQLAAAIAAARDTVDVEEAATARRDLLDSVERLGELDAQLVLMEALLADQKGRLRVLEEDFLGHQETALVILVRGLPDQDSPAGLILTEDRRTLEVLLTADQQVSLRQGGVAQVFHRFVEPRDHLFEVGFAGAGWDEVPTAQVPVTAARDRITFVELDLNALRPDPVDVGLQARVWVR